MSSNRRIARKDSELLAYFNDTNNFLKAPFREAVILALSANSTENVNIGEFVPPYMTVTLENTGAPTDADLLFCMTSDEDNACTIGSAILLTPGNSQTVTMKDLGYETGFVFFNVTNADPTNPGSGRISFQLNWQRLGMVEEQFLQWRQYGQNWTKKYLLAQSDATKTKAVVSDKNLLREEFTAFAENILTAISGNINLINPDRAILNLPARDREPSPRPAITEAVYTMVKTEPGCTLQFKHRVSSDSNRSSILPASNGVEIRWIVLDADAPAPTAPAQCTHSSIATKAIHYLSFGVENANKKVYFYCRWINTSDPSKNGPWSTLLSAGLVG